MRTVAERWSEFETAVLPTEADAIQRQEMRRSYYAGFFSALMAGLELANESGADEELGVSMIQALHDECQSFKADVTAGRA